MHRVFGGAVRWPVARLALIVVACCSHSWLFAQTAPDSAANSLATAERVAQSDAAHAIEIAESVLSVAEADDDVEERAAALRVLAIAHYFQADFPRALERAVAAEALYRSIGDLERQASILSLMGAIHGSGKQPERALEVYRRALEISREAGARNGEATVLMNIGKTLFDQGGYDESIRYYEAAIEGFDALLAEGERVRPDAPLFAQMGIADARLRQGRTDLAIERASAVLTQSDPSSLVYQNALAILGESHLARGELSEAERYLTRTLAEAERTQRPAKRVDALNLLARLAERRGDFADAIRRLREANALNLDIYNARNSEELARLEARFESDLRNQQIQLQALQLERNRSTIIAVSTVAVGGLLFSVILFQLYRAKRRSHDALRTLAETDPLTGLLNRRSMYTLLRAVEGDTALQSDCAICLLDVDNFKQINDRYGHAAGDQALVAIARALTEHVREDDQIARWGGEEFLVLLRDRSADEARQVAQRLCDRIGRLPLDLESGVSVEVTISVGVAQVRPDASIREIVKRADAAMYEAKQTGKNRIVLAGAA